MAPTVSIIMPAYNAEKYLGEAVDSVISQSLGDWELLLVDDGSTDGTGRECDDLAGRDPRIRAFHKTNGGLSDARNHGLDRARGDYIVFLDSDDVLSSHFLAATLAATRETGSRLVCAGHERFDGSVPAGLAARGAGNAACHRVASREAVIHALYQTPLPGTRLVPDHSAWGKLYGRELWEGLRFTKGTWYEDLDVFSRVWSRSEGMAFLDVGLLGYRQHGGSFLHRFTPSRLDVLDVTDRLVGSVGDDADMVRAARTRRFAAHFNILGLLYANGVADAPAEDRCRRVILTERYRVLTDRAARRKDRLGALASYAGFGAVKALSGLIYGPANGAS